MTWALRWQHCCLEVAILCLFGCRAPTLCTDALWASICALSVRGFAASAALLPNKGGNAFFSHLLLFFASQWVQLWCFSLESWIRSNWKHKRGLCWPSQVWEVVLLGGTFPVAAVDKMPSVITCMDWCVDSTQIFCPRLCPVYPLPGAAMVDTRLLGMISHKDWHHTRPRTFPCRKVELRFAKELGLVPNCH